jgi:hypothetical protein
MTYAPSSSRVYLQSRAARSDAAGANTLAEALGNLPLALDHAAAYCKRTQMQFGDFAKKAASLINAAPRGVGYPRSVAATFDLAISEAVAQCQAAEALMAYLAQCAPERIPMALVEGAAKSEAERLQAVAALNEVSLIKHDPFPDGAPAVTVHRLVQKVAKVRSEKHGSAKEVTKALMQRLTMTFPIESDGKAQLRAVSNQLTPHLLALLEEAPSDRVDLLNRAGVYIRKFSMMAFLSGLISGHPDLLDGLSKMFPEVLHVGDPAAVRTFCERLLTICEKVLGDHPLTAETGPVLDSGCMLAPNGAAQSRYEKTGETPRACSCRGRHRGTRRPRAR